ncbi:MAG: TonB-dependent receptor [Caulobacterales bacterium]|nr:TonB-dependent receptor [Caulobacterales bacterium]
MWGRWGRAALMASVVGLPGVAVAQSDQGNDAFSLGEIVVTARTRGGAMLGGAEIGQEELRTQNRQTVDDAMNAIPGANAASLGGASGARRNERVIYIRGFDRYQTTLSIDGVRVFLPADNRIDFGRFLTADLASIQVSKGYVSVLDGPGGLGGGVNLVTRRPESAFEWDVVGAASFGGDGGHNGQAISGRLGWRQGDFYAQLSGALTEHDHWALSDDFTPTANEDGGERINSSSEDYRYNLRVGYAPNATDEYAISYIRQSGAKNAPYHTTLPINQQRYWTWPYWNLDSLYFLSTTKLGDSTTLRTRFYVNTFENLLSSFDDAGQMTQSLPRAFDSYYDDTAFGGNVQLSTEWGANNMLRGAFHFRRDEHNERNAPGFASPGNLRYEEPWQTTEEDTYSVALENTHRFGEHLDWIVGASYDWTDLQRAEEVNNAVVSGNVVLTEFSYPLLDMHAFNWQTALTYNLDANARVYGSVSSRTRFPTLFERFSSRFGTVIPNPGIGPERAVNYELGVEREWAEHVRFEGALFYSDIQNALVSVSVDFGAPIGVQQQTRNVASAHYYGGELSLTWDVADALTLGGNYTYIERDYEAPTTPAIEPEGVPTHKVFAYADWRINDALTFTPSVEIASDRWTSTAATPLRYYRTGNYMLFNTALSWQVTPEADVLFGARNLTDENYQLADGLPEQGRNFYLSLRLQNR